MHIIGDSVTGTEVYLLLKELISVRQNASFAGV